MNKADTICSISTPQGIGAIAVIRISGNKAFTTVEKLFMPEFNFKNILPNWAKFAEIYERDHLIDQVIVVKFKAPHSYTGEDMVEISCHGSLFIQKKIMEMLIEQGCRTANAGEFTLRAFLNGKMDLPQAEAIADLIDSQSETSHKLAINQLKGGFSKKMKNLRTQFVEFASLLELELDFSEEDVQFANREQLQILLSQIKEEVTSLMTSFKSGNVLKSGIPVAIIGKPNVGKSTLLNALIQDDRAIVSHIPGTTRDTIEDTFNIEGITFRFIDTAGIRITKDEIENFGIERTYKAIEKADIILYMIDITKTSIEEIDDEMLFIENEIDLTDKKFIIIANKIDQLNEIPPQFNKWNDLNIIYLSAKRSVNIDALKEALVNYVNNHHLSENTLLTNVRHYDIMNKINESIESIEEGFANRIPIDLIAIDVRNALHYLGLATGEVSTDEILNTVFGRFCIGK
ncbi:MAG: tRNA uridine-5-carboxymethylaminomethyl(34) synthesis GTPase MnmE [Bacteroidales bacterium]